MKFWIICGWQNFFRAPRSSFPHGWEKKCCGWGCQNKQENFQKTSKESFSLKPDWITTFVSLFSFFPHDRRSIFDAFFFDKNSWGFFGRQRNLIFFLLCGVKPPKLRPTVQILKKGARFFTCLLLYIVSYYVQCLTFTWVHKNRIESIFQTWKMKCQVGMAFAILFVSKLIKSNIVKYKLSHQICQTLYVS